MTKQEIKDEIKAYEDMINEPSVPQDEKDAAKEEIADLKKQLAAMEEKPAKETKKVKKSSSESQIKGKTIESQIKGANVEDQIKKEKPKKIKSHKRTSEKTSITVDGKVITEGEADYCKKVIEAWQGQKEKKKASAEKSAAKPEGKKAEEKIIAVREKAIAGDYKRSEILALIKDATALLVTLRAELKKTK